jgi:hypothetical protein
MAITTSDDRSFILLYPHPIRDQEVVPMRYPKRGPFLLALLAVAVVALLVHQSHSSIARRAHQQKKRAETSPPRLEAATPTQRDGPSPFALARTYLLAREVARAEPLFMRLWRNKENPEVPREVLAFSLGLCAEVCGDMVGARRWYQQAENLTASPGVWYRGMLARLPRVEQVAAAAAAFRPEGDPSPEEVRKGVREALKKAEAAYKSSMTAPNRAMVLAWRMMDAELGVLDDKLYNRSTKQFLEALKELRSFETDLRKDPKLREELEKDPVANARYGQLQVRLTDTLDKFSTARKGEETRLQTLRAVIGQYKGTDKEAGCLTDVVEATTALLIGKNGEAATALAKAASKVEKVKELVSKAKDQYLFSEEKETGIPDKVGPFSPSFEAHLDMLQGYVKLREAQSAPAEDAPALLDEAAKKTADAQKLDANHPLGAFVLGLVRESEGVLKTRPAPAKADGHADAAPSFKEAQTQLTKAVESLDKRKVPPLAQVRVQAEQHLARLKSADTYLKESDALVKKGQFTQAVSLLGEGQLRHRDARLWMARVEMARRAFALNRDNAVASAAIDDLAKARAAGLVGEKDSPAFLAEGKLRLALLQGGMDRLDKLTDAERKELSANVEKAGQILRQAHENAQEGVQRGRCSGFLALALAYQKLLTPPKEEPGKSSLDVAKRDPELREALTLTGETDKELAKDASNLESQEAIAAGQLARGHLAVQMMPSYRDVAVPAFNRALTVSATLPYPSGNLGSLGAPLLAEMKRRPENALALRIDELSKQRRTMTRFVEGAVVLTQDQPAAASEKMARGLELLKKPIKEDDPLEEIDLEDRLLGYLALSQTRAGKPETAVVTILRTFDADLNEDSAVRASADLVKRVPSPTMTYALAVALEQRAEALGLGEQPLRAPALAGARAAYEKTRSLLTPAAARESNPGFAPASVAGLARITSDKGYLARWQTLHGDNRFAEAARTAFAGLTRNPRSPGLWRGYFDSRLALLIRLPDKDKAAQSKSLLQAIDHLAHQAGSLRFERAYYEAVIREQLKEWDAATKLFGDASRMAPTKTDHVLAETKKTEMELNLVAPSR